MLRWLGLLGIQSLTPATVHQLECRATLHRIHLMEIGSPLPSHQLYLHW